MVMSGILIVALRMRSHRPILILMGKLELVVTHLCLSRVRTPLMVWSLDLPANVTLHVSTGNHLNTHFMLTGKVNCERA